MSTQTATLTSPDIPVQIEPPGRPRFRWGILFVVWLLVFFTSTVVTFTLPESFSSTATIRVERDQTDIPSLQDPRAAAAYDPYFIQTEFEVIRSEVILGRVITNGIVFDSYRPSRRNLNEEWGPKIAAYGDRARTEEILPILRRMLALQTVRNTSLIQITVTISSTLEGGHAAKVAAQLANAIAEAYRDYRQEKRLRLMEGGIAALKMAYKDNQQQVYDAQAKLAEVMRSPAAQDTNIVNEAAQRLDGFQRMGQLLSTKIEATKADLLLPASAMVEIVEHAVPSMKPFSPNKSLNISLGILVGGGAGFFLATLVYVLQWLEFRRRSGRSGLSPQSRIVIHILIALSVGLAIGYLLGVPLSWSTIIGIPLVLLGGGGASAYIELARFRREAVSGNGNPQAGGPVRTSGTA